MREYARMATATLVHAGAHRLRYLITAEGTGGEQVSISTIGSATPDTLTDSVGSGTIKKLSKVVADGYGTFAAGAQTQAKAQALWDSNLAGADPSAGSANGSKLPTAKLHLTRRAAGGTGRWGANCAVTANNPVIQVSVSAQAAGETAYLDIEVPNTIGA